MPRGITVPVLTRGRPPRFPTDTGAIGRRGAGMAQDADPLGTGETQGRPAPHADELGVHVVLPSPDGLTQKWALVMAPKANLSSSIMREFESSTN